MVIKLHELRHKIILFLALFISAISSYGQTANCIPDNSLVVTLDASGNGSIIAAQIDNGSSGYTTLSIDQSTFSCSDIGDVTIELTANGTTPTTCTTIISVQDTQAPTPDVGSLPDVTGQCSATIGSAPTATDNCGGTITGTTSDSLTRSTQGTSTVTWSFDDGNGQVVTQDQDIVVNDTQAPTIICPATAFGNTSDDGTGNCTTTVNLGIPTATDNCTSTGNFTFIARIAGVVINPNVQVFDLGDTIVSWTAVDESGNVSASCDQTVTVTDNEDPTISCPADQNVSFDNNCQFTLLDYTSLGVTSDNCDNNITVTQSPIAGTLVSGTTTVTLIATDDVGRTDSCTFDIIPTDTVDPIAVCQNYTATLSSNGTVNIAALDVDNGSSDNCGIVNMTVSPNSFNCGNVGDNTVTFTVYDAEGRSDSCTAIITVVDNTPPTMLCNDFVVVINAITRIATIVPADVDNGSNDSCGAVSLSVSPNTFPENPDGSGTAYTTTTTLTAIDVNGNVNTCVSTITVEPPKNQFTFLTGEIVNPIQANPQPPSALVEATNCPADPNDPIGIVDVEFNLQAIGTYNLQASDVNFWEYSIDNGENWITIPGTAGILTYTMTGITQDRFVRLNITDNTDPLNPITKSSAESYVRFLPPDEPPVVVSQSALDICLNDSVTVVAESFFDQPNGQFGEGGEFNYAQPDGWRVDGQDGEFPASGDSGSETTWKETNSNNNAVFSGINYDTTDNTKFALAHGVGNTTTLETPVFSTIGMTSSEAIMSFNTSFYFCNGGYGTIELSFDSGNTYTQTLTTIEGFNFTDGNTTGVILDKGPPGNRYMGTTDPRMVPARIDLGPYVGLSGLRVRFTFVGSTTSCGNITNTTFPNPNNVNSNNTREYASGWAIDAVGFAYAQVDDELEWTDEDNTVIAIGTTAIITPITPGIREYGVTNLVNGCRTDNNAGTNFVNINTSLAYAGENYTPIASECGESALQLNAYDNTITAVTNYNKGAWINNLYVVPNVAAGDTDYAPTGVTGQWSIVSSSSSSCGNSATFSSNTDPDAIFTADPGNYTLRWTLQDGSGCFDDVNVTLIDCNTVNFDGTNDYVTFKNNYGLNSDFSIEVWVKPNSINGTRTVFSRKDSGDDTSGYDLSIVNGQVRFNWFNGASNGSITSLGDSIGTDRWYHLSVTFNGSTYTLYVDGIELNSGNGSAPALTSNNIDAVLGAMDQSPPGDPVNYFHGWMDEFKVWDKALNIEHIRQMMNQEIEALGTDVGGVVIPRKIYGVDTNADGTEEEALEWGDLLGYYRMNVACGDLAPFTGVGVAGRLRNITTSLAQTAPIPYTSRTSGQSWITDNTWTHFNVWDAPNSNGINGSPIDWNIVSLSHNVNSGNKDITVLGLISNSGELIIADPTTTTPIQDNHGQMLWVTQYLRLDGEIDLVGESQLIQKPYTSNQYYESILDENSTGSLERDQQGIMNSFAYNYWSPPVSRVGVGNNQPSFIKDIIKDGTNSDNPLVINWGADQGYFHADGALASPINVASAWIWKFVNLGNDYANWIFLGKDAGTISPGEGYTMKGVDGGGSLDLSVANQNYVYKGKPNNAPEGVVGTPIVHTTFTAPANTTIPAAVSLAGNPFPSALDADLFIIDNQNTTNATLYFWEHWSNGTHEWELYQGGYATYKTSAGGVAAVTHPDISTGGSSRSTPGRYVPVGQGFYVIGHATNSGPVVFKNSQRVFERETENGGNNSVFIRGTNSKKDQFDPEPVPEDEIMRIRLGLESPEGFHRQLLAAFFEGATDEIDHLYDGRSGDFLRNDGFFIQEDKYFVIQSFGEFNREREIPLSIFIDENFSGGVQKFMIDELENVPDDVDIYIKDYNNDGETYDIRNSSSFEISLEAGEHKDRFALVFKSRLLNLEEIATIDDGVTIFMNNSLKEIVVQKNATLDFNKITLFNYIGQSIKTWTKGIQERNINLPVGQLSTGAYILKIDTEQGVISKKLIIE